MAEVERYWSQRLIWTESRKRILTELSKKHLTFGELTTKTRLSRTTLGKHVKELMKDGVIKQNRIQGRYTVYQVTEKGKGSK